MTVVVSAAERALAMVEPGMALGLGTGRAASAFLRLLAEDGPEVRGLATSEATAALARELGIPLLAPGAVDRLDLAVDGADEVDPEGNLIKGWGGALVREKVVAAAADRLVILAGPEKRVGRLGERGRLPVEVLPFAEAFCRRRLAEMGLRSEVRRGPEGPFVTDNGNRVLDLAVEPLADPASLERELRALPGVVGTGLFLGLGPKVFFEGGGELG